MSTVEQLFETPEQVASNVVVPVSEGPLAVRMRPTELDQFLGQEHILAEGSPLKEAIADDRPHSMVLYGPPGSGKTTLARVVATHTAAAFEELSAVNAGRPEVREILERAKLRRQQSGPHTILFLDEIHRFNKAQQDALLPAVEEGLVTLIGATTENPYFEVNSALLSRCQVFELKELSKQQILTLLKRALETDAEVSRSEPSVSEGVLAFIAARCGGDARVAYNALELACETAVRMSCEVTIELAEGAMQKKALLYDKGGDQHYDYISAFIKSMRGSDPDAAVYYLAVMLEGGEDPRFVARRMVIFASEDVGNADPQALQVAVAAAQAVEHVGLPECRINLSQAATYLALAPKSNAAIMAIDRAAADVRREGAAAAPAYLRDAHYPGAKELGRGEGYDYPHSHEDALSDQQLLPDEVVDRRYYEPSERGFEAKLAERLERMRKRRAGER